MAAPMRALATFHRFAISSRIAGLSTPHRCVRSLSTFTVHQWNVSQTPAPQSSIAHQIQVCNVHFMLETSAQELWGGVTGVSNAGKKRGRGKRVGRKKVTDLNKGQVIGTGKINMVWPGLNAPVIKGRAVVKQQKLEPNPDYSSQLVKLRDEMSRIRYNSLPPLSRGWSGSWFPGQSVGPPDPIADYKFENFDSRVLEFRIVTNMTGTLGRKQRFTAFVVTGNGNGLAGYGLGRSQNGRTAIRVAKNRAAQRLFYVDRFGGHTLYHNMFSKYHRTKIFIHKQEEGYGLKCHRALKTICELIGIKNLHCKVEGNTKNVKALTKGFFEALNKQETHTELAEKKGYHIVEMRPECGHYPNVIASPPNGITKKEPLRDEEEDLEVDFERLYYGGKTEYKRPERKKVYEDLKSWKIKSQVVHRRRNQADLALQRQAGL